MPRTDKTLVGVSIFNALSAFGGGAGLVTGMLPIPRSLLRHTPFDSYVIPGLFLGLVIGGTALAGAAALLTHARRSRSICISAGVIMVGWIVGETILIQGFSLLQGLYLLTGLLIAVRSWYLPVDCRSRSGPEIQQRLPVSVDRPREELEGAP